MLYSRNADKKADQVKRSCIGNEASAGCRNGGDDQDQAEKCFCSELVAQWTEEEAHKDGASDANDGRGPDLLRRQVERHADLLEKRRDGEPDEEGNKEGPPSAVEDSHVGAGERAHLDLRGLVVLIRVDSDVVRLVLLPATLMRC